MRIGSRSIVFICLVNLVRGHNDMDENSENYEVRNAEWQSERISKINRNEKRTGINLASKDSKIQPRRWKSEVEIRDFGKRTRPFASSISDGAERQGEYYFESQKGNFRNDELSNFQDNSPSPILLPPYDFDPPVYHNVVFDNEAPSPWKNESLMHAGKSSSTMPLRINEITTANSSTKERPVKSEASYGNDDSTKITETNNEADWMRELVRESSVNVTKTSSKQEPYQSRSFYIDEELEKKRRLESSEKATNGSNLLKNSRGNRKYQRDRFESEKTFTRKRTFSSFQERRYDRQRRPAAQRSNHFRFNAESNGKVGAIPGIPGRDYPVHQEHTHHHLRNVVDRFPCPRNSKNHVYLADRASRCQIFYVCYGSNTGVPMVCPNGTLFSEPLQVCDWWFNVVC